jgi:ABC-type Fe3+/spermidine/putrescine transport system ATPase subunit
MSQEAVRADNVSHRYGRTTVLSGIDIAVRKGEFITFLGPSGCGKTTLLRIMAGFLHPSEGSISLFGSDVTSLPPHKRPVNMVFQRPALFPHLDVGENVAFSLELGRRPKPEISRRVAEALALVRLPGYERRKSHELSGGQMQRVALARVLIARPKVLLLDEPLSALDLAIRLEMESELRRVHRETGGTFVYVTHDQREALALSDRVVVFNDGRPEQIGRPDEIYRSPSSAFVARFVGDANVLPARILATDGSRTQVEVAGMHFDVRVRGLAATGPAELVVRQEEIGIAEPNVTGTMQLNGTVRDFAYRGAGHSYQIEVAGLPRLIKAEIPSSGRPIAVGASISLSFANEISVIQPVSGTAR